MAFSRSWNRRNTSSTIPKLDTSKVLRLWSSCATYCCRKIIMLNRPIKILICFLIFIAADLDSAEKLNENKKLFENIIALNAEYLSASSKKDSILLSIGLSAMELKASLSEYRSDERFKNICHMKIVKSENFGDFISYDGFHFKKILKDYPKSNFVDDAEYYLIYIVPDEFNYDDLQLEKEKLDLFIKKYPKSNLYEKANKRLMWLIDYIKSGKQTIID